MQYSSAEMAAVQAQAGGSKDLKDLEPLVTQVEQRLQALGDALRSRDAPAVELHAGELHHDLARAVEACMHQARNGGVPAPMRLRLAQAGAMVAHQREMMARATAALDRAIDVLMPPATSGRGDLYGANGRAADGYKRGGTLNA